MKNKDKQEALVEVQENVLPETSKVAIEQAEKPKLAPNHFIVRNKENKDVYIQITQGAFEQLKEFWEIVEDEKEIEKGISTLIGVDNTGYISKDCSTC